MKSFLIVTKDKDKEKEYFEKLFTEYLVERVDIYTLVYENKIGIEDVRNLSQKLYLRPIKGDTKAIIIQDLHKATLDAQNALLKILEEPPKDTIILTTTTESELILPTIRSRTTIVSDIAQTPAISDEDRKYCLNIFKKILAGSNAEKLKLASDLSKNKEEILKWLAKMIIFLRMGLLDDLEKENGRISKHYLDGLRQFQKTLLHLSTTNVAARFALENLFLSIK